jgi:2-methylcitrate dehydratase PrpD
MDIAQEYVDYARGCKFEDLPFDVVECAKKLIFDGIAVMIGGSSAGGIGTFVDLIREWGGKPESTILVFGDKVPAPSAVACNAAMARANDYGALHERAIVHMNDPLVPGCLAIAERQGGISGKEYISALVVGMEIMARLGLSLNTAFIKTGFQTTNHIGSFGTTLSAGKLLGLDYRTLAQALGIAYGQIAGTVQATVEGSVMVRIQQGFAAEIGIRSAIMAQKGIDGPAEVFQGKFGYFPVFHQNQYDPSKATDQLGRQFEIKNVSIKSFPCCFLSHFANAAMLQLVEEERISFRDVDKILVRVNQGVYNVVCDPLSKKRNPTTAREALFSLPYTVAAALVRNHVSLEDFTAEAIQDPVVRTMANKVTPVVDQKIEEEYGREIRPAIVEVTLRNGRKASRRVDFVKGHPNNPMTLEEVEEKFKACLPFAAKPLSPGKVSALIAAIKNFEALPDVSQIVQYLK